MTRTSKARYRWGALVLVFSATALAQQQEEGVSFEAKSVSVDLRTGGSLFTGLAVTDGAVSVNAMEGTHTSEGDDGVWDVRGGLRISIDVATLTADTGTLRYTDGVFSKVELLGTPVTLDGSAGSGSRPFHLTAGRISYDGARQRLTASEGVVFASNGMEIRNCSWTYDLSDKSVQGLAEADGKCNASVPLDRRDVP
jgi:lipopolysaccharide export system protein LptA